MFTTLSVAGRTESLAERLVMAGASGALVSSQVNIRWLTGFSGSAGLLVVSGSNDAPSLLVTDGRYAEQAARETADAGADVVVIERRTLVELRSTVAEHMAKSGSSAPWAIEVDRITLSDFGSLVAACAASGVNLTHDHHFDVSPILADLRRTKSPAEIERIAAAARIADSALAEVCRTIAAGTTEAEIRDALELSMRRHGADDVSFPTIVASGANSALPHHRPSARAIMPGESIVVDFGALVDGYHSDMTRTFVVDGPGASSMIERQAVVREACEAGVAVIKPGVVASEVDAACRKVLAGAGLEHELTHGVGHGVGLLIHEAPWVNAHSRDVLRPGDVVTVEPGAYRVGVGGARVEELILVTDSGHVVLSNSPKESTCLPSQPTTSRME